MTQQAQTQQVTGTVEVVNATGFKLNGAWYNYSQYHPDVTHPPKGAQVQMEVENGKWVTALTITGAGTPPAGSSQNGPRNGWGRRPQNIGPPAHGGVGREAIRAAAVQAAATLLAGTGNGPDMMLRAAATIEAWITRPAEPAGSAPQG